MVSPTQVWAHSSHGFDLVLTEGGSGLLTHPDSNLWLHAPAGASRIEWNFGLLRQAYEKEGDKTDGVEFVITGTVGGNTRQIFHRLLDPARLPADRGTQHISLPYQPRPGELLLFATRPVQGYAFDWAYWEKIAVK